MSMHIIMKEEVIQILTALALAGTGANLATGGGAEYLAGYNDALRAAAVALGAQLNTPAQLPTRRALPGK